MTAVSSQISNAGTLPRDCAATLAKFCAIMLEQGKIGPAKLAHATLANQVMPSVTHDECISLANSDIKKHWTSILVGAWAGSHNMHPVEMEFETAICGGDGAASMLSYRRKGKSTWGNIIAIRPDVDLSRTAPEGRLWFIVKENNPIRMRQTTRNELKIRLKKRGPWLVNMATKESFADWTKFRLTESDIELIRVRTNLTPKEFWRAVKNGSCDLVQRFGATHSKHRERLRHAGMFVAKYVPPAQMEMFDLSPPRTLSLPILR